jgi:type I protein arginine methyltransferase
MRNSKRSRAERRASRRPTSIAPLHRVDETTELGQFIPLHYHGQMLADEQRMSSFQEAIAKLVPVGAHVVELGAGTGVLSFFASKRARRVTCVERLHHVAAAARRLLAANGASENVSVVHGDARNFLPDEPADVVICELLHVALLREKQAEVIASFRARHEQHFGRCVPRIIPEASILAVQPVFQPYDFHGYHAPVPLFLEPGSIHSDTLEMGPPEIYATIDYLGEIPNTIAIETLVTAERPGSVNALRFITKNLVGIFVEEGRSADWRMPYMSLPLPRPLPVRAGDALRLSFRYHPGASIESLTSSLRCELASKPWDGF